jgi:bifunctional UDP-N-acetylglucosamine pyrophosphorylase / glucosamine-1-phosphate N-acetyltransferase
MGDGWRLPLAPDAGVGGRGRRSHLFLQVKIPRMISPPLLIVILAAGMGVRMRSQRAKVLHRLAGRSLLGHALAKAQAAGARAIAVVVPPASPEVRAEVLAHAPAAAVFEQPRQAGTADAVLAAREALARHSGDVLVLFADTPLLDVATLERLIGALGQGANIAVLGFEPDDPTGYGRLIRDERGRVLAIREHKDASAPERSQRLCNAGAMAFRVPSLLDLLGRIGNDNASREYYLTDAVALANLQGLCVLPAVCAPQEALGINTRAQLAEAEAIFQRRARAEAMRAGVSMTAPDTVWFSYDTKIAPDVTIEPNVFFGPGVEIAEGAEILANSHIVGARIGAGARVGPFARLRPGAEVGPEVHIGNFVEIKNARLETGAKANHLAYIGDGRVGAGANIGAGAIFCNYDGYSKNYTDIGAGAFIGSNAALIAPVKIGERAYVASGSVISRNVEPDALAIARSAQEVRPGWAAKFKTLMQNRRKNR